MKSDTNHIVSKNVQWSVIMRTKNYSVCMTYYLFSLEFLKVNLMLIFMSLSVNRPLGV